MVVALRSAADAEAIEADFEGVGAAPLLAKKRAPL